MNEELNTVMENETTEVVEVYNEPEESGNGNLGKIVLGVLGVGVAAAAGVLYATRDKREARKIEKLRKKGYTILAPGEDTQGCDQVEFYEESEEE